MNRIEKKRREKSNYIRMRRAFAHVKTCTAKKVVFDQFVDQFKCCTIDSKSISLLSDNFSCDCLLTHWQYRQYFCNRLTHDFRFERWNRLSPRNKIAQQHIFGPWAHSMNSIENVIIHESLSVGWKYSFSLLTHNVQYCLWLMIILQIFMRSRTSCLPCKAFTHECSFWNRVGGVLSASTPLHVSCCLRTLAVLQFVSACLTIYIDIHKIHILSFDPASCEC